MLKLLPEPKRAVENRGYTTSFRNIGIGLEALPSPEKQEYLEIARMRFWNRKELGIVPEGGSEGCIEATIIPSLANIEADGGDLFLKQGYYLNVDRDTIVLKYQNKAGFINAITTLKQLLKKNGDGFALPLCEITDWPTVEHRALQNGARIAGYFVWSLLDNYELAKGYTQRFGIVWVNFETQQRIPKDSAAWYARLIAAGTLPDAGP